MKANVKGFRNNFRKFKASAKSVPNNVKLPAYWKLVEECLQDDEESVEFVRERWSQFRLMRLMQLENKLEIIKPIK